MNRVNSSRQTLSAKQRNCNYHPNGAIAAHVLKETIALDSNESIVTLENGMYGVVSSKFPGRFYIVNPEMVCSASDTKVAEKCIEAVQAFQAAQNSKAAEKAAQDLAVIQLMQMQVKCMSEGVYSVPSQTEDPNHIVMTDENGKPVYCSCRWYKNGGWSKKLCKHAEAVILFIQEEKDQVLIASRRAWLAQRKAEIAQAQLVAIAS